MSKADNEKQTHDIDAEKSEVENSALNNNEHDIQQEKSMKDEITELIKPIAIHEAKSAIYKAKLAGYVLKKGAQGANKAAKFIHEKAGDYIEARSRKKDSHKRTKK